MGYVIATTERYTSWCRLDLGCDDDDDDDDDNDADESC